MNLKSPLSIAIILFLFYIATNAQNIDRGPYLQMTTTSSIYIHWRTDSPTDTKVWYGDAPDNLLETLSSSTEVEDHEILIPGLTSNTVYYYAVGNSDGQMAGGDDNHYFKTAPSGSEPIKIWVLGDAGKKSADQAAVRDAYYDFIGDEPIDFMLLLGDNAYSDGTQQDYQVAWFESTYGYPDRLINSTMWSTFGNHDGNSADSNNETGPYYDIYNFPKNAQAGGVSSGTEAYYSFDYGNMHIICLNSHDIDDSSDSPMIQWLAADVEANNKDWLIAMFHHPAYQGGTSSMETNALPILEEGGADLVLVGHHHWYERSFLIHGHYGNPASFDPETMALDEGDGRVGGDGAYTKTIGGPGTIYMTSGSAGSGGSGNSEHPIMSYNGGKGSVDIEVNGLQMDLKFIKHNGIVTDSFTISKQDGPPTVNITNPMDNDFYPTPEAITITADATDNGSVSKVEFFIDNGLLGTDYSTPYSFSWTPPGDGNYQIKATATDNDNNTSSSIVDIQVGGGSVCVKVNSSSDDGEEDSGGGMSISSSDLEMVQDNTDQTIGIRFTNLNIPQGAIINAASIQFTCDQTDNVNPVELDIYAQASDDAPAFSSTNSNITSRTRTNSKVTWSPENWTSAGDAGPDQETDDISAVIQEVVDREGFTSNSSIAIIIDGTGKRTADSYNGNPSTAPELCVEFSLDAPLPIELLNFSAKTIFPEIKLSWVTASEINNDFFMLERSNDGRSFQEIGTIPGKGNATEINKYHFFDENPKSGINYYRLKQTDFDGSFTYSNIVNATINNKNHLRVYPSAVDNMITIEAGFEYEDEMTAVIYDIIGRSHKTFNFSTKENKTELSLTDLQPGTYILSVSDSKIHVSFKFIKL